jgi:urea transport system ATP-binding protein
MLTVEKIDLYYGAAQALRGVSLTAEIGQVTCLLGRNGVGKSSTLRAIVGHQPIKSGTVHLNGEDISQLRPELRARRGIAYVPQGREIFPLLTVAENLETGFAPLPRAARVIPPELFDLFPILQSMMGPWSCAPNCSCSTSRRRASSRRSSKISAAPSITCGSAATWPF